MKKIMTSLLLAIVLGGLGTGCSTTLQHGAIYTKPMADKGPLGLAERAQNMDNHIGWGTFTVFAIPVAPVSVTGEADKELMDQVKDAVIAAGYQVQTADHGGTAGNLPVLSCRVKKFSFRNYTYFFPFVFNWGTIQLDVNITAPGGQVLWERSYTGKGSGMYDFNPTVNTALTTILNQLSGDLQKADFKSAMN